MAPSVLYGKYLSVRTYEVQFYFSQVGHKPEDGSTRCAQEDPKRKSVPFGVYKNVQRSEDPVRGASR